MLRNYLIVAVRSLRRHRVHTAINLAGLSLGMAFCVLAWRFASHEWSYDLFHGRADRIHRVYVEFARPDGERMRSADALQYGLGPVLEAVAPEVERAVRMVSTRGQSSDDYLLRVVHEGRSKEEAFLLVDASVFDVFDFPLERGDPRSALGQRNSVVLSHNMAARWFGDRDPMGQRLSVTSKALGAAEDFVVTGVAAPLPPTSSIRFNMMLRFDNVGFLFGADPLAWDGSCAIFCLLAVGAGPADIAPALSRIVRDHILSRKDVPKDLLASAYRLRLQPLGDIHHDTLMYRWVGHAITAPTSPVVPFAFLGIAAGVLLMACINFVNLTVGRAAGRAPEIGVRKSVGATRAQLLQQFLGEAAVLVVLGQLLGLALADAAVPTFNALFGTDVDVELGSQEAVLGLLAMAILVSLGAGGYPALVLSRLRPLSAIQRRVRLSGPVTFTRVLVGLQLALSIGLITATVIIRDQVEHLMTRDLGLDSELVVVVDADGLRELNPQHPLLLEAFARSHGVAGVSSVRYDFRLDDPWGIHNAVRADGAEVLTHQYFVDPGFVEAMRMRLAMGRNFDLALDDGKAVAIVSETLARRMGWAEPVGQELEFDRDGQVQLHRYGRPSATVVGVVEDFTFRSGYESPPPGVLLLNPSLGRDRYEAKVLLVRLHPGDTKTAVAHLADSWAQIVPHADFRYSFLQSRLAKRYAEDVRWQGLVTWAALSAVGIAILGAFTLTALAAGRRTREIGVRKVLGATVTSVVTLLTREYALLGAVGAAVAWPLVWWLTRGWLEAFVDRIELEVWHFAAGGLLTLCAVTTAAGYQAVKAAMSHPADALRCE